MQRDTDTGSTGGAAVASAAPNTAGHSKPFQEARKGKRNTGRGLAVEDKLAIIQQMMVALGHDGMPVTAMNHPRRNAAILVLDGVRYCPKCKHLRLFEQVGGDGCQYCIESV